MAEKLSDRLKAEILALPVKEKDKLLLRLITNNKLLREQLQYKLLEDEADLKFRREDILEYQKQILSHVQGTYAKGLLWHIRKLNAQVTWHKKVTKDQYGEIQLMVALLKQTLIFHADKLEKQNRLNEKLALYLASRVKMLVRNLNVLHEDFRVDFDRDIGFILDELNACSYARLMQQAGLPAEI